MDARVWSSSIHFAQIYEWLYITHTHSIRSQNDITDCRASFSVITCRTLKHASAQPEIICECINKMLLLDGNWHAHIAFADSWDMTLRGCVSCRMDCMMTGQFVPIFASNNLSRCMITLFDLLSVGKYKH